MGSDAEQKIRQLGIPVGSVRSPWLVVSVFRHGFLSTLSLSLLVTVIPIQREVPLRQLPC
jgi:hypothetical protein